MHAANSIAVETMCRPIAVVVVVVENIAKSRHREDGMLRSDYHNSQIDHRGKGPRFYLSA